MTLLVLGLALVVAALWLYVRSLHDTLGQLADVVEGRLRRTDRRHEVLAVEVRSMRRPATQHDAVTLEMPHRRVVRFARKTAKLIA